MKSWALRSTSLSNRYKFERATTLIQYICPIFLLPCYALAVLPLRRFLSNCTQLTCHSSLFCLCRLCQSFKEGRKILKFLSGWGRYTLCQALVLAFACATWQCVWLLRWLFIVFNYFDFLFC